ncbi:MAG: TusE/DsrC/DsvC family sulfur relay protein [Perlucidibaca sp.]
MSAPFWDLSRLDVTRFSPDLFDPEGFLRDPSAWSPALADEIARCLDLHGGDLTVAHRQVLDACRDFHARYQRMPTTRVFVKYLGEQLGPEFTGSATLMRLFPDTPMRLVALCAGLPKPPNCF